MSEKHSGKNEHGKKRSIAGRVFLWFLLLIFLAAIGVGGWLYYKYGRDLLACRDRALVIAARSSRSDFANDQTSILYYSDGNVMQILSGSKNVYYLPFSAIPKNAVNAVLAVEDRKFYTHKGYDVYAIARAAKAYIENEGAIKQGGSTITQQLARSIYLTNEKTIERKATEIFLAAALERKYSKKDILEFYLNNIYFANGYYGIQAAAKGYFGKTAGELSLSQTAFLCGIPNSPANYNPITHFEKTMERRDSVLKQMYENGFIVETDYRMALAEGIRLVSSESETNNYEETYTFRCAIHALMQAEGFAIRFNFENDEDRAMYEELYFDEYSRIWRNLYAKGYRIYTSINPAKQAQLQASIDEELADHTDTNDEGIYKFQSAGVCIDNDTGFVVAIVGGRGQETVGYTLNRAFQSPRQPGSSIKPLIVYTPVFERGYYPDTTVVDEKFEDGPANSGGVYSGEIDVRYAVSVSKNTVAWKLLQEIGVDRGLAYLKKMNFASIVDTDYYPAAALGGLTYGATAVEMTAAYATLANDGVYRAPTCIVRITDTYGSPIVDNSGAVSVAPVTVETKRIYEKNAARMMTDVMTTVMTTGTGRRSAIKGITTAGKTGTTKNQKDGWFVGYSAYYTTGIWVGCDMPETIEDLMGNTYPAYIWHSFMQAIHEGFEDKAFEPYRDDRPKPPEVETYPYGWVDNDGDGVPDGYPIGWIDKDGDDIPDGYPDDWIDTDGDGIPDFFPVGWTDTDGDGIPDLYTGDGIPYLTPVPTGGIPDGGEGNAGEAGEDGTVWVTPGQSMTDTPLPTDVPTPTPIPDAGIDTDGDGLPDTYPYGWIDTDGDGIPDSYPLGWIDKDGDGIPDGYPDGLPDADGDGVPDLYESDETIWVKPGTGVEWVNPRTGETYIIGGDD